MNDSVRRVGAFTAACVLVSNAVGSGIFTTTGFQARDLGEPWLILSLWVLGGLLFAVAGSYLVFSILQQWMGDFEELGIDWGLQIGGMDVVDRVKRGKPGGGKVDGQRTTIERAYIVPFFKVTVDEAAPAK